MTKRLFGLISLLLSLNLGLGCSAPLSGDSLASLDDVPTRTPQPTFTVGPTETPLIISTATPIPTQITPTNIPEASPTPVPIDVPTLLQATMNVNINVRAGPGTSYNRIAGVKAGATFEVVGRNAESTWIVIQYTAASQGWIFAELANISGDVNSLAVIEAGAPPPPRQSSAPQPAPTSPPPAPEPQPQYQYSIANVFGQKNEAITQIRGRIKDASGNPVNGVRIRVRSGDFCTVSVPSGTPGVYPNGNYDILLDARAKPGQWQVAVVDRPPAPEDTRCDPGAKTLSEEITVPTDTREGVVFVEYRKNF